MKIGVSKVDITPSESVPLAGYAHRKGTSSGIIDRIYGRILLINDVVIISLELLNVDEDLWEKIALLFSKNLGVSKKNIIVTATHTHSAPVISWDPFIDLWIRPNSLDKVKSYREFVVSLLRQATKKISIVESSLYASKTLIEGISSNRVDPRGPIDREAVFLFDSKKNFIAINFACHPTILPPTNNMISGDLAGAIMRLFEKTYNTSLYLNGAAGNISTRFTRVSRNYREVLRLADLFYSQAIKSIKKAKLIEGDTELKWEKIKVKTKKIPDINELETFEEHLLSELKLFSAYDRRRDNIMSELLRIRVLKAISKYLQQRKSITLHLVRLTIGDEFAAIFVPAEMFIEYQIDCKKFSQYKYTMFVGYANGYAGYIPYQTLGDKVYEVAASIIDQSEYKKIRKAVIKLISS